MQDTQYVRYNYRWTLLAHSVISHARHKWWRAHSWLPQ